MKSPEISHGSVTANGVRFAYASAGARGAPLVLLLHGFPERWFSFKQQLGPLADAGYHAVAPDLRGYGDSDKPDSGYDLDTLALDVAALIPALGADRAVVVGHDWGGAITWEAAARHPHRVAAYAVLNAPHPVVFMQVLRRSWAQVKKSWYMGMFQLPFLPEWMLTRDGARGLPRLFRQHAVAPERLDEGVLEELRASVARPGAARTMLAYYRAAGRELLFRPGQSQQRLASYPIIEQPGMLLWAEADKALGLELVPPHTLVARDLRVRRVPGCGHFISLERPEEVTTHLLAFLREVAPTVPRV